MAKLTFNFPVLRSLSDIFFRDHRYRGDDGTLGKRRNNNIPQGGWSQLCSGPGLLPYNIRSDLRLRNGYVKKASLSSLHDPLFSSTVLYLSIKLLDGQAEDQRALLEKCLNVPSRKDVRSVCMDALKDIDDEAQVRGKKIFVINRIGPDTYFDCWNTLAKKVVAVDRPICLLGYAGLLGIESLVAALNIDQPLILLVPPEQNKTKDIFIITKIAPDVISVSLAPLESGFKNVVGANSVVLVDDVRSSSQTMLGIEALLNALPTPVSVSDKFAVMHRG